MIRKYLSICLVMMLSGALQAHSYTNQSVLSSGHWVKLRVAESGIYCLTYEEIAAMGLAPEQVRIYGYGGAMLQQNFRLAKIDDLPAVSFYMSTGSDGVFSEGDYILFYAQGSVSWAYENTHFVHTRNPYSDYGYYFLSDNAGEQHLISETAALTSHSFTADTYSAYRLHEKDSVNLVDVSGKAGGGREFYGEKLSSSRTNISISLPFENVVPSSTLDVRCRVAGAGLAISTFTLLAGSGSATTTTEKILISDFYTKATTNEVNDRFSFTANGTGSQQLQIRYSNSESSAVGYLNYVEMTATCKLQMNGQEMLITNTEHYGNAGNTLYQLCGATSDVEIWDITTPTDIKRIPTTMSSDTLKWIGYNTPLQRTLAVCPQKASGWLKPTVIGQVANQNLHALHDIDMVIICPEMFLDAAQVIADAHERYDGITTAVVTDQQVYNEFSSGTPDATAYRWVMKILYDRATTASSKPKSLLLFGDGSFDNRKLLITSGPNTLLTYQAKNSEIETKAYASDDYFGFLDDNEGSLDISGRMDIGVGRLPASTTGVAMGVAQKIATYLKHENRGSWHQQLMFVADDGDSNLHTQITDLAAERVRLRNQAFVVNKIYIDAYQQEASAAGESYPQAKELFSNLLSDGVLFFDYSGHGGNNNITSENLLTLRDCGAMTNENQAFWMLATCGFAHFDATAQSASEEAVINPNGGAIAVLSACRTVYASQNKVINRNLCDTLFGHANDFSYTMTIGEATRIAKNLTGSDENKMSYILLGDPAIRLPYPTDYRVRTELASDTLNALTLHTFAGWIEGADGDTAREFNGEVKVTLMDKMQQITTLDNDHSDPSDKVTYTYNDYPNTLYQGTTKVENGHFTYTFMTPKDIRYNFGNGRITYFAIDSVNGEGVGHYEDLVIGGSSSVEIIDTIGPDIRLYLNDPAFASGNQTHENPHFYAELYDDHGINTVGSGIGHDLLLTIDDDPAQMIVLNNYFLSGEDYRSGLISYRMTEQTEGQHVLTLRAWDMLNNSNTASLSFEVVKGLNPQMYSVVSYPNPVRVHETMYFDIAYDRPDELLEMNIYVYAPSGELVYSMYRKGTEQHSMSISNCNLTPGIYIYRTTLTTSEGVSTGKPGKLIVIE